MARGTGTAVVVIGVVVVVVGLLIRVGALDWFGQLPGDIRVEGENSSIFIPLTSGIIASVVLTVVLNLVSRFLR